MRQLLLQKIMNKNDYHHEFQPIFELQNKKRLGFEAFLRSNEMLNPENIFRKAKLNGTLFEIDVMSIQKAITNYASVGYTSEDGKLFLNILPSTILHDSFIKFIRNIVGENYINTQEIVLEISESEIVKEFDSFLYRISYLKELGFKIAIDDYGKGYSDIKNIVELDPHYLKLDRYFSINLASSSKKQELITFILNYCEMYGCNIILEGIERKIDLETANNLGVHYAQGYFLSKPTKLKAKAISKYC